MNGKMLGKISRVKFGFDDDGHFGLFFTMGGIGWGVDWHIWTHEGTEANASIAEMTLSIRQVMKNAQIKDITKLVGIPIEATFKDNVLQEWRVLEEVL